MIIAANMNLTQLAELMGDTATEAEASAMRDLLVEAGHEETSEIEETEWCQHLCQSVEIARATDDQTPAGSRSFRFSANGIEFGDYQGETQEEAQEAFAKDASYSSWAAMVEQAEEFGGNTVEVRETSEA